MNYPPITFYFTLIQLAIGFVMAGVGFVLLFVGFGAISMPPDAMIAICLIAIAVKYLTDGAIQAMSAMSTNVEQEPLDEIKDVKV